MFCRSLFVLFLLAIVLSVLLLSTDSDYLPLFGHCIVCSSSIYGFWLPLCLVIVLSVRLLSTDSDYPFGIFKLFLWMQYEYFKLSLFVFLSFFVWSLYCLSFDLRLLITSFLFSTFSFQHNNTIKVDINVCGLNC
jgi:hypothetical protein